MLMSIWHWTSRSVRLVHRTQLCQVGLSMEWAVRRRALIVMWTRGCQLTSQHSMMWASSSSPTTSQEIVIIIAHLLAAFISADNIHADNISSKIVPLEKQVVIYGANALSLIHVVLFVLSMVFTCDFFLLYLFATFLVCVWYDWYDVINLIDWLIDW